MSERGALVERLVRTSPAAPYLLGLGVAVVLGLMQYYWSPALSHNAPYSIALGLVFGVVFAVKGVQFRRRS